MTYDESIETTVKMYARWIDECKANNGHAIVAREAADTFPEVFYRLDSDFTRVLLAMQFTDSKELVNVLRWFRVRGYRPVSYRDDVQSQKRDYELKTIDTERGASWQHEIVLVAYFTAEDGACQYVEVGQRVIPAAPEIEVPVFELRCNGTALPGEEVTAR